MAIVQFTGFEINSSGPFDTDALDSTCSVQSSIVRTGNYAMRCNCITTQQGNAAIRPYGSTGGFVNASVATSYVQFYFRYATKPASNYERIFYCQDGDTPNAKLSILLDSAGKLRLLDKSNAQIGSAGATTLSADTWYKINVKIGTGASAAYELKINDVTELSGTADLHTGNATGIYMGKFADLNSQTVDFYYDDVVWDDAAYPAGNAEVKLLLPVANGSTMSWTNGTNTSDYTQVDENPPDVADYIMSLTSGAPQIALFDMESCASKSVTGTILSVKLLTQTRENTNVTSSTKSRIKSGGSNADTSASNGNTVAQSRNLIQNTNPATGMAWTTTTLDAAEFGVVEDNNVAVRASFVYAMVVYLPSTSTNYTMTADQASFSLTGQTSLLKIGRKMLATYATFALTSQTVLLKIGRKILAVFGSFTLNGQNVALRSTRKIVAALGSFTLSGQTVILRYGKTMGAAYGSFILTGQNVLLKLGRKMTAVQGSFTLSGQTALLKLGRRMQAVYGIFALNGQNVLLKLGWKMQAVYTTFTLTGQTVLLKVGRKITAVYGTFTLTGQSILFHIAVKMYAIYGQFTLTGQSVLFAVNGLYVRWTTAVKNAVATLANRAKNSSTWTNRDKTL